MTPRRTPLAPPLAPVLAAVLLTSGCGSGTPTASPAPSTTSAPTPASPGAAQSPTGGAGSGVPSPTAAADDPEPAAATGPDRTRWVVVDRSRADVDGDGTPEALVLRAPRGGGHGSSLQLVVQLADGTSSVTELQHQPFGAVYRAADIDAVAGQEVFVLREYPRRTFTVLTWRDGALVPMTTPPGHPLTDDYDDRHRTDWWVLDGRLLSSRSVRRFRFTYESVITPDTFAMRVWRWRADGLRLHRQRVAGRLCVQAETPRRLYACE